MASPARSLRYSTDDQEVVVGADMLKRIEISEVNLGMFIHKMEGNWLSHPFWRARFLVATPEQLEKLQESELSGLIIDTSRGADLGEQEANAPVPTASPIHERRTPTRASFIGARRAIPTSAPGAAGNSFDLSSTAPQTTAREFGHATRVAGRAQKVVSRVFLESRLGKNIKSEMIEPVIEDIFASVQRNPHAFNGLMRCKRENGNAYRQALAVSALMISLGRQLKLPPAELRLAGMAGLLINVGIGLLPVDLDDFHGDTSRIPEEILQSHVRLGHDFLTASGMPEAVVRACLEHHERLDGSGYPAGLRGEAICPFARMAAICETYDNLTNNADGACGLNPARALTQMGEYPGLDAQLLEEFTQAMGVYPIGSVVLLRSGRLAMVIDQNASDISLPCVRTFFSVTNKRVIAPVTIDLANCRGEDALIGAANPEDHDITHFPDLRTKLFASNAE